MKKKILHFADHLTGKADGIFAHILLIMKYSDKNSFEHYLCFQGDSEVERKIISVGGKIIILPRLNKRFPFLATYCLMKHIICEDISIIHAHFLKPYIISSFLRLFLNFKLIYNYHGLFIDNEFYDWYEKKIYQTAHWFACKLKLVDVAIAPSVGSREKLLRETSIFPKIISYYNCAESCCISSNKMEMFLHINKLNKGKIIVGIIARIVKQKRPDLALLILKNILVVQPETVFVFCGDGEQFNDMLKLSEKLGVKDSAFFVGYVEDIKKYLTFFDFLLFTSDYEGFPVAIWEALAAGVPIVSTDIPGIEEIIERENCGLLFKKGSIEDGVSKVLRLINDKDLREKLSSNCKKAVSQKYNAKIFGEKMTEIYNNLTIQQDKQ